MGLAIGSNVISLTAVRDATSRQLPRNNEGALRREDVLPPRRNDQVEIRAGFGENTISLPFLALRTVNRNVENARETIPTREEIRARIQEYLSTQRDQAAELARAQEEVRQAQLPNPQLTLPEPSAQVQSFVDSVIPTDQPFEAEPVEASLEVAGALQRQQPVQSALDTVNRIDILI
jgi:hypothetical protein